MVINVSLENTGQRECLVKDPQRYFMSFENHLFFEQDTGDIGKIHLQNVYVKLVKFL
jgi:hypothetical protein